MKELIFFIMLLFLFIGCNGNSKKHTSTNENQTDSLLITKKFVIHPKIIEVIEEIKNENPDLENQVIAVYFTDSLKNPGLMNADSAVIITQFDTNANLPQRYYKGIIEMDSTIIVLFDRNKVGLPFYDNSVIKDHSLSDINKTSLEVLIISALIIKNDSLYKFVAP